MVISDCWDDSRSCGWERRAKDKMIAWFYEAPIVLNFNTRRTVGGVITSVMERQIT